MTFAAPTWTQVRAELAEKSVATDSGCVEWVGQITGGGYGRYRGWMAHRIAYEADVGPIPAGLDIDHLCRNRRCINPAHLEPVTRKENLRRGVGVMLALVRTPMDAWARIRSFFQRPRAGCSQCGGPVPDDRRDYAWPMCHGCLPPTKPLPVRRKCRRCIHGAHTGMCSGRNGGTGYPCPCIHSSGGEP